MRQNRCLRSGMGFDDGFMLCLWYCSCFSLVLYLSDWTEEPWLKLGLLRPLPLTHRFILCRIIILCCVFILSRYVSTYIWLDFDSWSSGMRWRGALARANRANEIDFEFVRCFDELPLC